MPKAPWRTWSLASLLVFSAGMAACQERNRPSPPASAPRTADQPQGTSMGAQPGSSDMATAGGSGAAMDGGGSTHTAAPVASGQTAQQPQDGGQADGGPTTERR